MRRLILCLPLLYFFSCTTKHTDSHLTGPYFGLMPSDTPTLLAPGLISTSLTEYNGTFPPTGTEFFFTAESGRKGHIAWMSMNEDQSWTEPVIAPFSGTWSEYDPLFSPDGQFLYFSSERPVPGQTDLTGTNIWRIHRTPDGWAAPELVPIPGTGHYFSSLTNTGSIFYNDWSSGDIFEAVPAENGFTIQRLPEEINGQSDVGDAFVAPDGSYLIFRGYFPDSYGQGDLYISFRTDSSWTEAVNLGAPINSPSHEMCPYVTADGKLFIFSSSRIAESFPSHLDSLRTKQASYDNGNQNIYVISASFIQTLRDSVEPSHLD